MKDRSDLGIDMIEVIFPSIVQYFVALALFRLLAIFLPSFFPQKLWLLVKWRSGTMLQWWNIVERQWLH